MHNHDGRNIMPVTLPYIPRNATVSNHVIADAIRFCLSDCFAHIYNDYETGFLLSLFHAHPDKVLTQRQGRFLAELFKRAERVDWRLTRNAWRIGGR
jgi:hypothetical protein